MRGLTDLFIGSRVDNDVVGALRARAHIFIVICSLVLCTLVALFFILAPIENKEALRVVFLALSTLAFLYGASLLATKFTDVAYVSGHFTTLWTTAIILGLIYINGGVPESDVTPLIILPIGMAFCFLGFGAGIIWTFLILGLFGAMSIAWLLGHRFPDLIATQYEGYTQAVIWLTCFIFLGALLSSYEWMASQVLKDRGVGSNHSSNTIEEREDFEIALNKASQRAIYHKEKLLLMTLEVNEVHLENCFNLCTQIVRTSDSVMRTDKNTISIIVERVCSVENTHLLKSTLYHELEKLRIGNDDVVIKNIFSCLFPDEADNTLRLIQSTTPYQLESSILSERRKND